MPDGSQTGFLAAKKEPKRCELFLAPELEAKLTQGRDMDKLSDHVMARSFNAEAGFIGTPKWGERTLAPSRVSHSGAAIESIVPSCCAALVASGRRKRSRADRDLKRHPYGNHTPSVHRPRTPPPDVAGLGPGRGLRKRPSCARERFPPMAAGCFRR
jgi:hypothetical protein